LSGFWVLLACLALGVMAIAGVGSVARSLADGLAREGRSLNGGDVSFSLIGRPAKPEELAFLRRPGRLSTVATLRAMARLADGRSALVEIKAVDEAYPLAGQVALAGPVPLATVLKENVPPRAVGDEALFARLEIQPGALLTVGTGRLELAD